MSPELGDVGLRTNHRRRRLDRGRGFKPREKHFFTHGTSEEHETFADIFSTATTAENRRHKTTSEENKKFEPGGKREKAPPWNAAVTLLSFSGESWEAPCLCFVFSICALFVFCFLKYFSFQVITSQRAEKHERRRGSIRCCTQPEGKHFLVYHPLEDVEDKQHPVWS